MEILLQNKKAFAYTAAHALEAGKPSVVFVHGAGLDHSSFALQSRYFCYHGWNVLAGDLPGHGRSGGPLIRSAHSSRAFCRLFTTRQGPASSLRSIRH